MVSNARVGLLLFLFLALVARAGRADPIVPISGNLIITSGVLQFLHDTDDPFASGLEQ
jgi:hypothetical protein